MIDLVIVHLHSAFVDCRGLFFVNQSNYEALPTCMVLVSLGIFILITKKHACIIGIGTGTRGGFIDFHEEMG